MTLENNALPTDGNIAAGEQAETQATPTPETGEQANEPTEGQTAAEGEAVEGEEKPEPVKKEKTAEQKEIDRLRRRVDNLTRQKYELRGQQQPAQEQRNPGGDEEPVTLTRAELNRQIAEQAEKLAPAVREQQAELERRQGVLNTLSKQWGPEKFNAIASELDDALGGLKDARGGPKPATEAIFEADDPKSVIEYLTDPDNADDAERIAGLSAVRAGREIARIEAKLKDEKAKAKAKPSNAARPIESVKGGGVPAGMPDPSNTKAYIKWANEQERAARR